jgi:cysteine desulfurase
MSDTPRPIYLDYNATTPILPEVLEAMLPFLREHFGNPSSLHPYGREARRGVELAREQVAQLLGCNPDEIIFTSGGTESNNLAIFGIVQVAGSPGHIVTSSIEHPATMRPCESLEQRGHKVTRLDVDQLGVVILDEASDAIQEGTLLVTVMHANNETGTIQPIERLAAMAKARGALVHTDAAQSTGKIPVNVDELAVDLLSLAGHKLYAPKGVGALYVRKGTDLHPVILGAGHERGLRPGTENVASIVGLGTACRLAHETLAAESSRPWALTMLLWDLLSARIPGLRLNGHATKRLPNTLNLVFPRVRGGAVLARATAVAASTGSACHAGSESLSPVLAAMGVVREDALGSIRLSLGRPTTRQQVEVAAEELFRAWQAESNELSDSAEALHDR